MPMPHSRPGTSLASSRSSVEQRIDAVQAGLRTVLDPCRLVVMAQDPAVEGRQRDVDAGRAEVGDEDVAGRRRGRSAGAAAGRRCSARRRPPRRGRGRSARRRAGRRSPGRARSARRARTGSASAPGGSRRGRCTRASSTSSGSGDGASGVRSVDHGRDDTPLRARRRLLHLTGQSTIVAQQRAHNGSRPPTPAARGHLDCLDSPRIRARLRGGPTPWPIAASIGAAVIGTGFIGTVHVEALRRIGVARPRRARQHPGTWRRPGRGPRRPARLRRRSTTCSPTTDRRRRPRHVPQRPPRRARPRPSSPPASTSSARSRWR